MAFLSIADKDKPALPTLIGGLTECDISLLAYGGTAQKIRESGIQIGSFRRLINNFPPDIEREAFAKLLAGNLRQPGENRVPSRQLKLVAVTIKPIGSEATDIDRGGPRLLDAAKTGGHAVLSDAEQWPEAVERLKVDEFEDPAYQHQLADAAETAVADYRAAVKSQFGVDVLNLKA